MTISTDLRGGGWRASSLPASSSQPATSGKPRSHGGGEAQHVGQGVAQLAVERRVGQVGAAPGLVVGVGEPAEQHAGGVALAEMLGDLLRRQGDEGGEARGGGRELLPRLHVAVAGGAGGGGLGEVLACSAMAASATGGGCGLRRGGVGGLAGLERELVAAAASIAGRAASLRRRRCRSSRPGRARRLRGTRRRPSRPSAARRTARRAGDRRVSGRNSPLRQLATVRGEVEPPRPASAAASDFVGPALRLGAGHGFLTERHEAGQRRREGVAGVPRCGVALHCGCRVAYARVFSVGRIFR